ncbi:hypothetical protein DCS_05216 [Drechmeria coniospora]|uniref:Uncharacterized protein n=1 Tax=Drechmeria coniospora TaxID=98403 RepID=A0A151GM68_DRECN|nr:hypothetical protein DCS_05216 [Drechmeria coniospora]KYK58203.1 hypothetical protein DCS_05216 [Drechmeria coniospora]
MATPDDVEHWEDQDGEATNMAEAYRELARYNQLLCHGRAAQRDPDPANKFHCASVYRAERTAQALESNLSSLETKLDDILAALESREGAANQVPTERNGTADMIATKNDAASDVAQVATPVNRNRAEETPSADSENKK